MNIVGQGRLKVKKFFFSGPSSLMATFFSFILSFNFFFFLSGPTFTPSPLSGRAIKNKTFFAASLRRLNTKIVQTNCLYIGLGGGGLFLRTKRRPYIYPGYLVLYLPNGRVYTNIYDFPSARAVAPDGFCPVPTFQRKNRIRIRPSKHNPDPT